MKLVTHQLYLLALLICPYVCLGSECKVQQSHRVAWLETSRVPYQCQGRCTRLVGVFCTEETAVVQLWSGSGDMRTLVWQKYWKPKQIGVLEYIDLEPDEYITIETNERIGLTTTGDQDKPISVRQIFNESCAQILSSNVVGPFQLQQPYQFGNIPYPGLFLLDFCDDSGCPTLNIPPGPISPPVKCDLVKAYDKIKLEKKRLVSTGVVKAIKTHFCGVDPVKVQLWDVNEGMVDNYRLVWQKVIRPIITSGEETIIPLDPDEYVAILDTYRLGMQSMNAESPISVPYRFSTDSSANLITSAGNTSTTCRDMQFEGLAFPSEFLLTFCYDAACKQSSSDPGISPRIPCSDQTYTTRFGSQESTSATNGVTHETGSSVAETSGSSGTSVSSALFSLVWILCSWFDMSR